MSSLRQFAANRRNALRSTGPITEAGKQKSRGNAIRHGLTAETVIPGLEDAEDYKAFEAAVASDYRAETAVERELVLRLASLLWRLRRATAIETELLGIQAEIIRERRTEAHSAAHSATAYCSIYHAPSDAIRSAAAPETEAVTVDRMAENDDISLTKENPANAVVPDSRILAHCFLRLANLDSGAFVRLNRYERALWRQAMQVLFALQPIRQL